MNARVEVLDNDDAIVPTADEVRLAVRAILVSEIFAKAPRMCDLLAYLIDRKLGGSASELSEYAIGLKVFRRDAHSYDTFLDPVVRVQMGRLRSRLATYYLAHGGQYGVRIAIPPGTYVPVIGMAARPRRAAGRQLEVLPLRDLTARPVGGGFVAGVDEELGNRLFQVFGSLVRMSGHPAAVPSADAHGARRLEGSIRVEHDRVRASVRLIDIPAGQVAWLSQFDCSGELGIRLQEQLAGEICERLQCYLAIEWTLSVGTSTARPGSAAALRWEPGMPVQLSLRLARDGAVVPKGEPGRPDVRVVDRTVSFRFDDPWALFSFINAYRDPDAPGDDGRGPLLRFEFPLAGSGAVPSAAADARARVFLRLRVSAPGKHAALAWPAVFPAQVPSWQEPQKASL